MKRITCSLCGGTGVAYEVQDPVEAPTKKQVPAIEKQFQLDLPPTAEEDEAWRLLEKSLRLSVR